MTTRGRVEEGDVGDVGGGGGEEVVWRERGQGFGSFEVIQLYTVSYRVEERPWTYYSPYTASGHYYYFYIIGKWY